MLQDPGAYSPWISLPQLLSCTQQHFKEHEQRCMGGQVLLKLEAHAPILSSVPKAATRWGRTITCRRRCRAVIQLCDCHAGRQWGGAALVGVDAACTEDWLCSVDVDARCSQIPAVLACMFHQAPWNINSSLMWRDVVNDTVGARIVPQT